jgi:hypothetical protein
MGGKASTFNPLVARQIFHEPRHPSPLTSVMARPGREADNFLAMASVSAWRRAGTPNSRVPMKMPPRSEAGRSYPCHEGTSIGYGVGNSITRDRGRHDFM